MKEVLILKHLTDVICTAALTSPRALRLLALALALLLSSSVPVMADLTGP